jgi:tetratricopeptide (TPR) repeat protein
MPKISPPNRFNRAVQYENEGNFEKALNEYIAVLNSDPTFRNAYINLGSLYSRMNRLTDAMRCYEAALALGHDYITYFNIGCIFYKTGNYSDALLNLDNSSVMNKSFALSRLVTGLCHSRLNRLVEAEKNFLEVLQLWPDNRVSLTALAIIYYNKHMFDQSLQLLNRLLQVNADNVKIRELKSDILLKLGRIDESASEMKIVKKAADGYRYFDEFIKSIPVDTLADKYGTIDEKIKNLNDSVFEDSNNLISLSLCHLFKGDTDAAIDYLFKYKKKSLN